MVSLRPASLVFRAWLCLIVCGAALDPGSLKTRTATAAVDAAAARKLLASRGLALSSGSWVTAGELELRKRLDALDLLLRRAQAARQQAGQALETNEVIRTTLRQIEAAEKQPGAPPPATPAVKSPTAQTKGRPAEGLQSQMPDVTGLGEQSPLQLAMIEWVTTRSGLLVAVLDIDQRADALDAEYRRLAAAKGVPAAIAALSGSRLGPVKDYRRNHRLAAASKEALVPSQPVYHESGQWRIGAILNEKTPVTFGFVAQGQQTWVASTVAQSLGLEVDAAAPVEKQRLADRELVVRKARLASLRLGKWLFRDIPVLVLPPDAEDLGSRLAGGSLSGCQARLEPARMTLELEAPARNARDEARGAAAN